MIGTTSTAKKAAIAKAHGVDHVIVYKSETVAEYDIGEYKTCRCIVNCNREHYRDPT